MNTVNDPDINEMTSNVSIFDMTSDNEENESLMANRGAKAGNKRKNSFIESCDMSKIQEHHSDYRNYGINIFLNLTFAVIVP